MRFEGQFETVECEDCEREISHLHNEGIEDTPLCVACNSRRFIAHKKSKCAICKKKMGDLDYCYSVDDPDISAHTDCVNGLSEEEQDTWSDDFEC